MIGGWLARRHSTAFVPDSPNARLCFRTVRVCLGGRSCDFDAILICIRTVRKVGKPLGHVRISCFMCNNYVKYFGNILIIMHIRCDVCSPIAAGKYAGSGFEFIQAANIARMQ